LGTCVSQQPRLTCSANLFLSFFNFKTPNNAIHKKTRHHDLRVTTPHQSAYCEDEIGGEKRTLLKFHPSIAPIKVAVFPLVKNKPELVAKARTIFENLQVCHRITLYLFLISCFHVVRVIVQVRYCRIYSNT
jgi:hypothetical protein